MIFFLKIGDLGGDSRECGNQFEKILRAQVKIKSISFFSQRLGSFGGEILGKKWFIDEDGLATVAERASERARGEQVR